MVSKVSQTITHLNLRGSGNIPGSTDVRILQIRSFGKDSDRIQIEVTGYEGRQCLRKPENVVRNGSLRRQGKIQEMTRKVVNWISIINRGSFHDIQNKTSGNPRSQEVKEICRISLLKNYNKKVTKLLIFHYQYCHSIKMLLLPIYLRQYRIRSK